MVSVLIYSTELFFFSIYNLLNHVFEFKSKTSPYYLSINFQRLSKNENRILTRTTANNYFNPKICTNTFDYSAICDCNELPSSIKDIKGEMNFKGSS